MKLNKQILEAINNGIQIALDDYEDNEQNAIKPAQNKIKNANLTKQLVGLDLLTVDFKLPSGTLWCKYNLGVDPTRLKIQKDYLGEYYAWGETEPQFIERYSWAGYKYANAVKEKLTKYCNNPNYGDDGYTDELIELLPEDDAAYQSIKVGEDIKFCLPTKEQFDELFKYVNHKQVDDYAKIRGLGGELFYDNEGNEMFIPYAGAKHSQGFANLNTMWLLWTCDLDTSPQSSPIYAMACDNVNKTCVSRQRCYGIPIRAVCNPYIK